MANKPKDPKLIEMGICGAKLRNPGRHKDGICHKKPMVNGRCYIHGGKSTGPKNSLGYYKKSLTEEANKKYLDAIVANPLDLEGEMALVRMLLARMEEDPLLVWCSRCRHDVVAITTCPNEVEDKEGKPHFVNVHNNDYSKIIHATKLLSDIAKSWKEIVKGKEVTLRVEVVNVLVMKVIEAYEAADRITDSKERRRVFVQGVEQLLVEQPTEPSPFGGSKASDQRQ